MVKRPPHPAMLENSDDSINRALEQMSSLTAAQDARVRRALKEEKEGSPLNPALSTEIRRMHRMRVDEINMISRLGADRRAVTPTKSGGIISQMLAKLLPKAKRPKAVPKTEAH